MQTNTKLQLLQYRLLNFISILRVFTSVLYKEIQTPTMTHFTIHKCILFIFSRLAQEGVPEDDIQRMKKEEEGI